MPKRKTSPKKRLKLKIRRRRPLHKKILLHPISIFILLCMGVLLIGITYKTYANSFNVTAKVSAPLPTTPADITVVVPGPDNTTGQAPVSVNDHSSAPPLVHVTSSVITLRGECQADTYIKIYRNDVLAGVTMCVGDPTFSIQIELVPGENMLKAQVFNITDDPGPILPAIKIIYDRPTSNTQTISSIPSGTAGQSSRTSQSNPSGNLSPLIITAKYQYKAILVGGTYAVQLSLSGGASPYALSINWGDGKQSTIAKKAAATFTINHTYKSAGTGEHQDFTIKIQGADSANQTAYMQLIAIVSNKSLPTGIATMGGGSETGFKSLLSSTKRWLLVAWPTYLIIILMAVSFKLGEREELVVLRGRGSTRRRHA